MPVWALLRHLWAHTMVGNGTSGGDVMGLGGWTTSDSTV